MPDRGSFFLLPSENSGLFVTAPHGTLPLPMSLKLADRLAPTGPLRKSNGEPLTRRATLLGLRAIAEALFTTAQGTPPQDRLDWLDGEVEDFLARAGVLARWTFTLMVGLIGTVAPLLVGRLTSLRNLDVTERVRALTKLEHKFSEPLLAVKAMLCILYYEHPDALREVGVASECYRSLAHPKAAP